jgi:DNA-binding transcriptional LysR family regulator
LDFGILRGEDKLNHLEQEQLGVLANKLFIPKSLIRGNVPAVVDALTSLPLVLLEGTSHVRELVEQACSKRRGKPNIMHECSSAIIMASIVASGMAAGPLPEIAQNHFPNDTVIPLDMKPVLGKELPLRLIWNPRILERSNALARLRVDLVTSLSAALN